MTQETSKLIKYKYLGSDGMKSYAMLPADALEDIKTRVKDESVWVFLDKKHTAVADLTEKVLESARDITLTPMLMGGCI
tara:strand:- start:1141 stop:1377 length:237 start_codon:yes stop_codon:yes gene_type:complete